MIKDLKPSTSLLTQKDSLLSSHSITFQTALGLHFALEYTMGKFQANQKTAITEISS